MASKVYDLLNQEVLTRIDHGLVDEWDKMCGIFEGVLPSEYDRFFPKKEPKQIINVIRLAWDDLATQVGRLPDLRADTLNNSDAEEARVALLERIGHNYLRNAEPSGKILMYQHAWWLTGIGRSVVLVTPDADKQLPIFSIRDPRTAYPLPKKRVGNQIVELKDIMFRYELTIKEMVAAGLKPPETTNMWGETKRKGYVIEFIDKDQWVVASEGGTVLRVRHELGVVPGWVFQTHSPNRPAGLSQFQDQVTLMVSISRLISQKLRFADRLVHPVYWIRGYEGQVKLGPDVINKLGPTGEMGQLSPPRTLQVDQDIEKLEQFSRILNRNPEVRQGEVSSKGSYTSAKTLEQLSEAIDTVVGRQWDLTSVGFQKLFAIAFKMDEMLWPNESKNVRGVIKNQKFRDSYIPSKDIKGRWAINVDYGFGLTGYQGFLMQLQAKDAGMQSKRRAMEEMPGVSDVDDLMREIELETMDDAATANFAALAAQGQLDMILWSKLRKAMAGSGTPLADVILEYEKEIQAQAQVAMEQGGADALAAAEPVKKPAEGLPALPGIPPAAMVG